MIHFLISHLREPEGETFYTSLRRLAIPIMMQQLMMSSLQLIDNIMVGRLGDSATGAVGLSNQYIFILILYLLGISSGTAMFTAQFWGKQDHSNVRRTLGLGILLAVPFASLIGALAVFAPGIIFTLFGAEADVTELGSQYLRIVGWGTPVFAITNVYAASLRSIEIAHVPMMANGIGVILNTILNYLLIFGKLGFPELGVAGAAYATLISRIVECMLIIGAAYHRKSVLAAQLHQLFDIQLQLLKRFLSQSGLLIFKDVMWAVGTAIYMMIYARMGDGSESTSNIAAMHIFFVLHQFANLTFFGIGSASQIMVGKCIGENNPAKAFLYAKRIMILTFLLSFIIGILFYLVRPIFLLPYNVSAMTVEKVMRLMTVFTLYLPMITLCMVAVLGHMRSGGDTVVTIVMDLIAQYAIGLPLALIGAFYFNLSLPFVFALVMAQEIFKGGVLIWRFMSGKWIRNLVHDFEGG